MKDGKALPVKDVEAQVSDNKVVFKIKKPTTEQTGDYQIKIGNGQGDAVHDIHINMQDVPTPPRDVGVKDIFENNCVIEFKPCEKENGAPVQKYVIEKQDASLKEGWVKAGEVSASEKPLEFKVTDLIPKKQYKFRVKAVNKIGASEPANLAKIVLAKNPWDEPGKPKNAECYDWDKDRANLRWQPPDSDGGSPITGYVIESKEKFGKNWNKVKEVGPDQLEAIVKDGLKENGTYEFRVRAVNKAGPGEPSDTTKPIIAKCRFVKPFIIGDNLKNVVIKKNQMFKFDIKFGGEPEPNVKWLKDGKEIVADDDRITIEKHERNTIITVKRGVRSDSGKYALELSNGSGTIQSQCDVIVLDKPTPPLGPLEPVEVRSTHAKVKWNKPKDNGGSDITGYVLEKMDMDNGRWIPAGEVGPDETTFDFKGLIPNKKYKFRVKAVNKEGESEPLETTDSILAKNPYDEPGKPGTPEIDDYDNKMVKLKWEPPKSDGGRPITGYIVEMKDKYNPEWIEVLKTDNDKPEAQVDGLKENVAYQFRVRAINKAGNSEASEPTKTHVCKHKNLKPRIDRNTFKSITIKAGRTHKWSVDISGEPPPEVFWIWRDDVPLTNTDRVKIENRDYHTDFTITNLTRKDTGKYTLKVVNRNGQDIETVELCVLGKPGTPQGPLKVEDITENGCKLKWKKPEDDGGVPIKEYELEKMDMATGKWVRVGHVPNTGANDLEFNVPNLNPGSEYKFRVTAVNDEGESEPLTTESSIIAKNPFDEPGKPGTPEVIDHDNESATIKWEKPKDDGGAEILKYIIEKKDKNKPEWEKALEVSGDELTAKIGGLPEHGEFQFRVKAVNKAGPGVPSDASKMQFIRYKSRKYTLTETILKRYTNLLSYYFPVKPYIDRTNLKPTIVKAGKPVHYDVKVRGEPAPTVTWHQNKKDILDNAKVENVPYNTKFNLSESVRKNSGLYTIKAVNEHGSDEAEVEITILSAPAKPKGPLKVNDITKNGCKLSWDKPEDDGGAPVTAYQVEKLDKSTGRWVPVGRTNGRDTELDVKGLQEGHEYSFRVKAINDEGESEPLESEHSIIAKNPYDVPGKPGVPEIEDWNEHEVHLKWSAPKNTGGAPITGYIIEAKEKPHTQWKEMLTSDTPDLKAIVPGLKEGSQYQFRVKAVNKAGPGEASDATDTHTAKARYLKPWINRDKLKPIKVRRGQNIKLEVDVRGEPPPEITWIFKDHNIGEAEPNCRIANEDYLTKFQLMDVKRNRTGIYKIKAENPSGVDEAELEITVLDKPGKPEGPLEVSKVVKDGCKLKWKKPKDDGGVPILSYVLEKQDVSTGAWVPCGTQYDPDKTEFDVKNLEPGKKYLFRVKAVNEEGDSAPLETENSTLAKDPFDIPTEPGLPEIIDYDENSVKLKWDPPIRDGGAPITNYQIEVQDKETGDWVKAVDVPGGKCEATVPKLQNGHQYKFRVRAANKAGVSDPSEETNWHKARPKRRKLSSIILTQYFAHFINLLRVSYDFSK